MKQRVDFIDIAKGLGILLVALGHNRAFTDSIDGAHTVIYLFHMPLFFFLSGVTTPTVLDFAKLKQRLKGLLKPYLVSSLIFLPRQLSIPEHPSNDLLVQKILWGSGNAIYNTPVWFLMALISGYLVYAAMQQVRLRFGQEKKFPLTSLALITLTYFFLSNQTGFSMLPRDAIDRPLGAPVNIDLAPLVASILLLGNWWGQRYAVATQLSTTKLCILNLAWVALFVILLFADPAMDLNYRAVQCWGAALVCSALGVAVSINTAMLIDRHTRVLKNGLVFLGKNTLIILIFHAAIQSFLTKILPAEGQDSTAINAAISVAVCMALAWLSEFVINRSKYLRLAFYVK